MAQPATQQANSAIARTLIWASVLRRRGCNCGAKKSRINSHPWLGLCINTPRSFAVSDFTPREDKHDGTTLCGKTAQRTCTPGEIRHGCRFVAAPAHELRRRRQLHERRSSRGGPRLPKLHFGESGWNSSARRVPSQSLRKGDDENSSRLDDACELRDRSVRNSACIDARRRRSASASRGAPDHGMSRARSACGPRVLTICRGSAKPRAAARRLGAGRDVRGRLFLRRSVYSP